MTTPVNARPSSRCPNCGASLRPGSTFCIRCRTHVEGSAALTSTSQAAVFRRPTVVTMIAVLDFIGAGFMLLMALPLLFIGLTEPEPVPLVMGALFGGFGVIQLFAGIGLWSLKSYGRTIQIVLSAIGLLALPLGTIISIVVLVYLLKPGVQILFSGKPRQQLTESEINEVSALDQTSVALVVVLVIAIPLIAVAVIGVIAAIAIPSLLRARVAANEAQAIADLRNVISAQMAYTTSNGGFYDELECLNTPTSCIPGYPSGAPVFLTEPMAATKTGYHRTFLAGLPASPEEIKNANASPSSLRSFAYVLVPVEPGLSGVRAFCGDDTGQICATADGSQPEVVDGRCAPSCQPLQ